MASGAGDGKSLATRAAQLAPGRSRSCDDKARRWQRNHSCQGGPVFL